MTVKHGLNYQTKANASDQGETWFYILSVILHVNAANNGKSLPGEQQHPHTTADYFTGWEVIRQMLSEGGRRRLEVKGRYMFYVDTSTELGCNKWLPLQPKHRLCNYI